MSELIFRNNAFYFIHEQTTKLLLDCNDFLSNKSRVPMHTTEEGVVTLPAFLLALFEQHSQNFGNTLPEDSSWSYLLTDLLLTGQLIASSAPAKVLAIGCENGVLSYHTASVMGKLNPSSSLTLVCNTIVNNAPNPVLDSLSLVSEAPQFSLCITDYDRTPLQENQYEVVLLDGCSTIQNCEETVTESLRLLKDKGTLLISSCSSRLNECLVAQFPSLETYRLSENATVFVINAFDKASVSPKPTVKDLCIEELELLQKKLSHGLSEEEVRRTLSVLDIAIAEAIRQYDIEQKLLLIEIKEQLQHLLLQKGTEFEEFYQNELALSLDKLVPLK